MAKTLCDKNGIRAYRRPSGYIALTRSLVLLAVALGAPSAYAQFLRIGPFDFSAQADVKGIFTTNVEGLRPSETTEEMEDYYYIAALGLNSRARMGMGTVLNLNTAIAIEQHANRPDLDNDSVPFGQLELNGQSVAGHYTINGRVFAQREIPYEKNAYVPGDRKTRDVTDNSGYSAGIGWARDRVEIGADYGYTQERHADVDFQDGDQNETTWSVHGKVPLYRTFSLVASHEKSLTDYIKDADSNETYKTTTRVSIDGQVEFLKRPKLTYSFGLKKEDTESESEGWHPNHLFTLMDTWDLSSALSLALTATYNYDQDPAEGDVVGLTGLATLTHKITASMEQQFSAAREPVGTFGSNKETDKRSFGYAFSKNDLFIYNLDLKLSYVYELNQPVDQGSPEEQLHKVSGRLDYSRAITRRIRRDVSYAYHRDLSNLEDDPLEEHRVVLAYTFLF